VEKVKGSEYFPKALYFKLQVSQIRSQEVDGTLFGERVLVVRTGAEFVEWYQMHYTWLAGV
jgi:hypothetical protein